MCLVFGSKTIQDDLMKGVLCILSIHGFIFVIESVLEVTSLKNEERGVSSGPSSPLIEPTRSPS